MIYEIWHIPSADSGWHPRRITRFHSDLDPNNLDQSKQLMEQARVLVAEYDKQHSHVKWKVTRYFEVKASVWGFEVEATNDDRK